MIGNRLSDNTSISVLNFHFSSVLKFSMFQTASKLSDNAACRNVQEMEFLSIRITGLGTIPLVLNRGESKQASVFDVAFFLDFLPNHSS